MCVCLKFKTRYWRFIDIENNNFALEKSSPVVDAGIYVGLIYDFNGMPIPFGYAPDIGLIETSNILLHSAQTYMESDETMSLDIYPNPATNEISVNYLSESNLIRVQVFDLFGSKLIERIQENYSDSEHTSSIDISSLVSGIYILYITNGEKIGVKKFIKK